MLWILIELIYNYIYYNKVISKTFTSFTTLTELQQGKTSSTEQKRVQKGVNATPNTQPPQTQTDNNFFASLLSLICGTLCKDSPLAEVIPVPVHAAPSKTTLSGRLARHSLYI